MARIPRGIVTLAIGKAAAELAEVSTPSMEAYAERVGATLHMIGAEGGQHRAPHFAKFQLEALLDVFDRILFLDIDTLVVPDSPDVFSLVPSGALGAVDVTQTRNDFSSEVRLVQRVFGSIEWEWSDGYFNSGVMLLGQHLRGVLRACSDNLGTWWATDGRNFMDQTLLNYFVRREGVSIVDLGYKWNHTPAFGNSRERFSSHVIHYAGHVGHSRGSRLKEMKKDSAALRDSKRLRRLRSNPLAIRLHDVR